MSNDPNKHQREALYEPVEPTTLTDVRPEGAAGAQSDPFIGVVLNNKYTIMEQVGRGGIGLVYRAVQSGLNRDVVIKLLNQENAQDVSTTQRFSREAQALSLLDHSNIVGVYDFGQEGDTSYIAMEYIDGISLDGLIKRMKQVPFEVFAPIARQILDAVGEAHRLGIIHRDIKPSNVMLTNKKGFPYYVKVLDFGLVKLLSEESDLTGQHKLVGTIAYLSPEQILGTPADQRVDVYALGVLFYHMLTGQKPFKGRDMTVLYQHIHQEPPSIHELLPQGHQVPHTLIELVHRCLAKDPTHRPHDANQLLEAFGRALPDPNVMAFPWVTGEFSNPMIRVGAALQQDSNASWDRSSSDLIAPQTGSLHHNPYGIDATPSGSFSGQHISQQNISQQSISQQSISQQSISQQGFAGPDFSRPAEATSSSNTGVKVAVALALVALVGAGAAFALLGQEDAPVTPAVVVAQPPSTVEVRLRASGPEDTGEIFVGERSYGSLSAGAPKVLSLDPGPYDIKVVRPDREAWTRAITVQAGSPMSYDVRLAKAKTPPVVAPTPEVQATPAPVEQPVQAKVQAKPPPSPKAVEAYKRRKARRRQQELARKKEAQRLKEAAQLKAKEEAEAKRVAPKPKEKPKDALAPEQGEFELMN